MTDPTPRPAGSPLSVSSNTSGDMYCAACDGKPGYMHSCSRPVGVGVDVQIDPICATCGGPIIDLWYPKDDVDLDDLLVPEFSTHGAAGESRVPPRGPNADGSWPSHGMVIDDKPGGGPSPDVPCPGSEQPTVKLGRCSWCDGYVNGAHDTMPAHAPIRGLTPGSDVSHDDVMEGIERALAALNAVYRTPADTHSVDWTAELAEAAFAVVRNAEGTKPRHTRAREGGCRDDCIPCGIYRLRLAVSAVMNGVPRQLPPDDDGPAGSAALGPEAVQE